MYSEPFKYGVIVCNQSMADEDGVPVLHFVGYWKEPTDADMQSLADELATDESFGLVDMMRAGQLEFYDAPQDVIDEYVTIYKQHNTEEDD